MALKNVKRELEAKLEEIEQERKAVFNTYVLYAELTSIPDILEKYKMIVGSSSNTRYLIDIFENDKSKLTILIDEESISLAGNSVTFTSFEYPKVCMEIIINSIKEALK